MLTRSGRSKFNVREPIERNSELNTTLTAETSFAQKMRIPIAVYLVASALYTVMITKLKLGADLRTSQILMLAAFGIYMLAMVVGGIGLLLKKNWAQWVTLSVFALQVVRFQIAGSVFATGSIFYFYLYAARTPDLIFGVRSNFGAPEFVLRFGQGDLGPYWIGVNAFAIAAIVIIRRMHRKTAKDTN